MSGIVGIIHFDGAPVEPGLVEKMTSAMSYRGPDGINHWLNGSVALGQCMLHTTPESLEETQPLTNEDQSLVLVMDGRVDNWEELRRELLSHRAVLRDRSDAELVLRAYQVWGQGCLTHIDGDFALAIWDAKQQIAFCARDRMAHKPFHYHWDGKTFAFASELHPLLALPWVKQEPNEAILAELLAGEWLSSDETLWRGIMRLMAAHRLVVQSRGIQTELYWEPDLWATLPFCKEEDYIEYYREVLFDSVRRLSRSHRPVAIDVSGGLDSSAVFCVADHLQRKDRLLAPDIDGQTLAFTEADGAACELAYARAVGEHTGRQIHEIPPARMPLSWFDERARVNREFPGYPNSATFSGLWRQAVARGSRVTLTGESADFWLYGSRAYYAEELAQRQWSIVLDCFRADMAAFGTPQAMAWLIRQGLYPLLPRQLRRLVRNIRDSAKPATAYWLSPHIQETLKLSRSRVLPPDGHAVRCFGQKRLLEFLSYAFVAQINESDERLSAQTGIEIRDPYSDRRFVQYAFSTPSRLRLRGDRAKYIHVRALQDLLPKMIIERKINAEFSSVFRTQLDKMQDTLTETLPGERADWVSPEGMARLFEVFRSDPDSEAYWILWSIYGCDRVFRKQ